MYTYAWNRHIKLRQTEAGRSTARHNGRQNGLHIADTCSLLELLRLTAADRSAD